MEACVIELPEALTPAAIAALERGLEAAAATPARVLVLVGSEPGTFCRGLDLGALAREADPGAAVRAFARCLRAILEAPRPTVAVVAGDALGGGLGIAAATDLCLATTDARAGLPEALFGILPAVVMPALLTRTSPQRARRLALTGATVDAAWAREAGLFDRVVEPARLPWARRQAVRELSRAAPGTASRLRALLARVEHRPLGEALEAAADVAATTFADAEVRRTVARFVEEGAAPWSA